MPLSENGWPAIKDSASPLLHTWVIPTKRGRVILRLRNGSAGFLLCHFLLWWDEKLEPLYPTKDDWGWNYRPVTGYANTLSNHSSGTAADANATLHPLGVRESGVFKYALSLVRIHFRLRRVYRGVIRWGGDYQHRADEMHIEINADLAACEKVARRLMNSPRGKRILAANPSQKAVILS